MMKRQVPMSLKIHDSGIVDIVLKIITIKILIEM